MASLKPGLRWSHWLTDCQLKKVKFEKSLSKLAGMANPRYFNDSKKAQYSNLNRNSFVERKPACTIHYQYQRKNDNR